MSLCLGLVINVEAERQAALVTLVWCTARACTTVGENMLEHGINLYVRYRKCLLFYI
jgi:hypothetical protein